jgi:hypothetical protein
MRICRDVAGRQRIPYICYLLFAAFLLGRNRRGSFDSAQRDQVQGA